MRFKYLSVLICLILLVSCSFAQDGDSGIEIEFLKPDKSIRYEKGDTIDVEVKITFPQGAKNKAVVGSWAQRSSDVMDLELTQNESGNYVAKIETGYEMESLYLNVYAKADIGGGEIDNEKGFTVNFKSLDLTADFEFIPPEPYYLDTTIERVKINVFYPDSSRVPAESLMGPEYRIGNEGGRLDLTEDENGSLVAELNYRIGMTEEFLRKGSGRLEFEIYSLRDKYNNKADNLRKDIIVESRHDSLRVRMEGLSSYEMLFHDMDFTFVIELEKGSDVEDESVFLVDSRDLENRRQCQKVGEEGKKARYECKEKTPSMEDGGRITYIALATATVSGKEITVYEKMETEVSNRVHLDNQYPGYSESLDELKNEIEVNFYYNEKGKLEGDRYNGTVNGKPVEFVWDVEKDAYLAEFDLASLGEGRHDLEFEVDGLELENDVVTVNFVTRGIPDLVSGDGKPADIFLVVVPMVVVFALFTFTVWIMFLRKKKEETIDELKEEAATLKELLKQIEIDFYKRRLNEAEYKKRNLEYQVRLEKVTAEIKVREGRSKGKKKR